MKTTYNILCVCSTGNREMYNKVTQRIGRRNWEYAIYYIRSSCYLRSGLLFYEHRLRLLKSEYCKAYETIELVKKRHK